MKNILIVSGHTDLNSSVANKTILEELQKKLPNAQLDCLDLYYANYRIDAEAEQRKLCNSDIIILQYPVFWYSMPSLMEKWMEVIFQHGFSHGSEGDKLKDKQLIASFTSGASEESYTKENYGFEIEELLLPIKATCNLCGMKFSGFVYTGGVSYRKHTDSEEIKQIEDKARAHVDRVMILLNEIMD